MQVLERQPWSTETSLTLHVVPGAMWQVPLMLFPIKIDPRSQKISYEIPLVVGSCQISKGEDSGKETRKQHYLCRKPLLSLQKKVFILKVLLKPSASKQSCLGGKRLKVPSLGMWGPEPPTPRGGTKELSDEACSSRERSPPFLLFHIFFLAHGPCFQRAKMRQGGAQSSCFLWALESQAFGGRAPAVKLNW